MVDVFISYARSDQAEAERLAKRLTSLGLEVWLDRGLTPGLDYAREIVEKLHAASAIITCWSANATKSRWVFAEALTGLLHNNLIPITLDGTVAPIPFSTLQAISMQRWAGRARHPGWRQLLERIGVIIKRTDLPDRDLAYAQGRRPGKALVLSVDGGWLSEDASNASLVRQVAARTDSEQRQQLIRYILDLSAFNNPTAILQKWLFEDRGDSALFQAYLFLVDNYDDGDRLYLFGAGTGAVTVRRLAHFLGDVGIVRRDRTQALPVALGHVFSPFQAESLAEFRAQNCHLCETEGLPDGVPPIAYVGLWDTVAQRTVMLVIESIISPARRLNLGLGAHVRAARHAIALDENRLAYPPTLIWPVRDDASISQRWFPGRTWDVMGGAASTLFSEPFLWVLEGAEEAGLELDRASERLTAIQEAVRTPDPFAAFAKQSALSTISPDSFPLRPRQGPERWEDVSPGARERWRKNKRYRPSALRRFRKRLLGQDQAADE